ncbi:MAG: GGDEF domain-containing protein, partial [Pseudoalteromonas shioyasakiensis]
DLALFYQLSGGFNDVVGKVHQDINEALSYSAEFNQALQECRDTLTSADISQERGFDDVLDCVERLSDESAALQSRAQDFQNQLALAYSEITELKQELVRSRSKAEKDP